MAVRKLLGISGLIDDGAPNNLLFEDIIMTAHSA